MAIIGHGTGRGRQVLRVCSLESGGRAVEEFPGGEEGGRPAARDYVNYLVSTEECTEISIAL